MQIDLANLIDINTNKKVYIQFDMIDEQNLYWASEDEELEIDLPIINYEDNKAKEFTSLYTKAFTQHPIIAMINVVCFIGVIILIIKFKKRIMLNKGSRV